MLKKLFITPWFGQLPEWFPRYLENIQPLRSQGYDWLTVRNLDSFTSRCQRILGFPPPIKWGEAKVHDYRPALGALFQQELQGYDYWGFTDFDCCYGMVEKWVSDEFLSSVDAHSDCPMYVCGPWSLFKNSEQTRWLFKDDPTWINNLGNPRVTAWGEHSFSRTLEKSGLRFSYTGWHSYDRMCPPDQVRREERRLIAGDTEVPMYHFRLTKRWPDAV